MRIRRVILKGVRNFVDFDYSFEDSWSGRVPEALLLIGPNGSGKTTLLSIIADLWQGLANHLGNGEELPPARLSLTGLEVSPSMLAAIEILGLESEPLWLAAGSDERCQDLALAQPNTHRVLLLNSDAPGRQYLRYLSPADLDLRTVAPPSDWRNRWKQRFTENVLGKSQNLPNVVYLESETRQILPLAEKFGIQPEAEEFHWLARYEPTTSRKGSLQNYLYNLKVVDPDTFEQIIEQANAFLSGKRLDGFDSRTGDLLVWIDGGDKHPLTELSSGEKQVLLMLATITRWLRSGGIVLIDEPDLHLHASLTTAFVGHLRRMVSAKDGQLLIASHALELWQDFTTSHRVELGRLSEAAP